MTGTFIEQAKVALRSPLTYAMLIIASVASYFVTAYNSRSDDSIKACNEQIARLSSRIEALEKMHDEYTRAVLFKDLQIREQAIIIDSLKTK